MLEVSNHRHSSRFDEKQLRAVSQDIDVQHVTDALMPSEVHCDVCCLVYDVTNPRSFEFVARIYLVELGELCLSHQRANLFFRFQKYFAGANIPVFIVGNKSELQAVRQDYILQPDAFCSKYKAWPSHMLPIALQSKHCIFLSSALLAAAHLHRSGRQAGDLRQAGDDGSLSVSKVQRLACLQCSLNPSALPKSFASCLDAVLSREVCTLNPPLSLKSSETRFTCTLLLGIFVTLRSKTRAASCAWAWGWPWLPSAASSSCAISTLSRGFVLRTVNCSFV